MTRLHDDGASWHAYTGAERFVIPGLILACVLVWAFVLTVLYRAMT